MAVHLKDLTVSCQNCLKGKKTICEFEIPGQELWEINGDQYKGCPFKIITKQTKNFLRAFHFFKQGYLPNQGEWINQSAKMLDAFDVIERQLCLMEKKS